MSALVIYHADCYDGFTAAWIARQAMPDCELFEGRYGEEPPYELANSRDVYVLDFSYPRDQMFFLHSCAKSLLVLDHHKTAEANCEGLPFCTFDMTRSGAGMAWDYWNPGKPRPAWINCVEERDLWQFRYDHTQYVHAYLTALPMTMSNWDAIHATPFSTLVSRGVSINRYIETSVHKTTQEARLVKINGHNVIVLNISYQNASETASVLLEAIPDAHYSMTYFQRADAKWQYSLRSRSDFDVSEIAEHFGGGGHAQAAGFESDDLLEELK